MVWFGERFEFNKRQATVVRVLWEAWRAGHGPLAGSVILRAAGLPPAGLDKLFKYGNCREMHPAWGRMIHKARAGCYHLRPSEGKGGVA